MPGSLLLQGVRSLTPTGVKGFEGLICEVLSSLSGKQFFLCKSGSQHGTDALAETIPVAIECKRYGKKTPLDLRELEGELSAVCRAYPRVQLWVLACSVECSAQDREELRQAGENLGIATLIIDASSASPDLQDVPLISALLAIDPLKAVSALSQSNDTSQSAIGNDIQAIRNQSGFNKWSSDFKIRLLESPIWSLAVQRHNRGLLKLINGGSRVYLGTDFKPQAVITRTIQHDLDQWLNTSLENNNEPLAVIQGDRYDGKTWCVLDWLLTKLPDISVPIFFVSSNLGMQKTELYELFLSETKTALGTYARHAECTLRRAMEKKEIAKPWCFLVVDGLNEYPDSDHCIKNILEALAAYTDTLRPALVLATVRTQSWRSLEQSIPTFIKTRVFTIAPYDDKEFQEALSLRGLPATYETDLPTTAKTMVRRPRFLDLVVAHRDKLGEYAAITSSVLYWLDSCDKIRDTSAQHSDFDVSAYQSLLKQLAARFLTSLSVRDEDIRRALLSFTSEIRRGLSELESEGVLSRDSTRYTIDNDRLGLGMGLHLLASLLTAHQKQQSLVECLRDLLSPLQETDEMVIRLRTAAAIALVHDPPIPTIIIDLLVREWLSSRNLADSDLQDFKSLHRLLVEPLLRMAPTTWSIEKGNERLQELSLMVFVDALPQNRTAISLAISAWFRMVPERGARFFQKIKEDKNEDPTTSVKEVIEDPTLSDLQLTAYKDEGLLKLHKAGLHLLGRDPTLVGPLDLLALIGTELAAHSDVGAAEQLVFRQCLESVDIAWFQTQYQNLSPDESSSRRRKVFHWLCVRAMRADLNLIVQNTVSPRDPRLESFALSCCPLSPKAYDSVRSTDVLTSDHPAIFAEQVRELVKDPSLRPPSVQRLNAIRLALQNYFLDAPLYQGVSKDIQDHKFEQVLPTIAAWFPSLGKEILERQIRLLPSQEPRSRFLADAIGQHAILLGNESSHILEEVASNCGSVTTDEKWMAENFLLVALPRMSGHDVVRAVRERKDRHFEWTKLYELAAFLLNPTLSSELLEQLRIDEGLLRSKRLRYLLAQLGGYILGNEDSAPLVRAIRQGGEDCYSALWLAVRGNYFNLPSEVLIPAATSWKDKQELASAYASLLLIKSKSAETIPYDDWPSRLAPLWRVCAAIKHPRFLLNIINEVEGSLQSLVQPIPQSENDRSFLLPASVTAEPFDLSQVARYSVSQSSYEQPLHFVSSESTAGGVTQPSIPPAVIRERLAFNRNEATREMQKLSDEAIEVLRQRSQEHSTCWSIDPFPLDLLEKMHADDPNRLNRWLTYLQHNSLRARVFWSGLLHSLFVFFLRNGDDKTKLIWPMVYPFSRTNVFHTVTFSREGINNLLCHLSDDHSNDALSYDFLGQLVIDARTDRELLSLAIGARLTSQKRLSKLARQLLVDSGSNKRALGCRLGGWLAGFQTDLQLIKESDPSLWVRKVASQALQSTIEETWAHYWFEKVLSQTDPDSRWGASQLFISCVDKGSVLSSHKKLNDVRLPAQVRGETWLLLDAADRVAKRKFTELQQTFLEYKVRDLEAVCHPWRPTMDWEEIEKR